MAGSSRTGSQSDASGGSGAARSSTSPTGTGLRARARWTSVALRCAIVNSQARRLSACGEVGVGAQRAQERLLERVVGVVTADRADEEAQHVARVGVEQALEGRRGHGRRTLRGAGT